MSRAETRKRVLDGRVRVLPGRLGWMLVVAGWAACALAVTTPLHIGTLQEIKDEFGQTLEGHASSPAGAADLVQVLWASNSIVNPPAYDGTPDPVNPVVSGGISAVGQLTSPAEEKPGVFGVCLREPRPPHLSRVVVRVFNAPTLSEASFYGDSEVLVASNNTVLIASITATTNAIDPRDNDADGLNNSWEKSYTTDPDDPDTDGDDMIDGWEVRAGTDLLDRNSLLQVTSVSGTGPTWEEKLDGDFLQPMMRMEDAIIGWQSVSGKQYQVDYTPSQLHRGPVYDSVTTVVTATDTVTYVTIPGGVTNGALGTFRVRLVE